MPVCMAGPLYQSDSYIELVLICYYENYIMIIYIIILKYFEYCQIIIPLISPIIYIFRTSIHSSVNIQCPPPYFDNIKKTQEGSAMLFVFVSTVKINFINKYPVHSHMIFGQFFKKKKFLILCGFSSFIYPGNGFALSLPKAFSFVIKKIS